MTIKILFALAVLILPLAARADPAPMTVSQAYAFAVPQAGQNGAAFMTLTYPAGDGIVPDRLIGVASRVADKVELHTMTLDDNVMTMRPIDSLPLPPTGSFMLKPQGVHVMLIKLKQKLTIGETFPLTLTFARAGAVATTVTVRAPGDIPAPSAVQSAAPGTLQQTPAPAMTTGHSMQGM